MQIRCTHCNRPFALSKDGVNAALEQVTSENLSHYNVGCPHCRKNNRVSRQELERAAPHWQPASSEEDANG